MDGGGPFDHALARDGWVAVSVGYHLAAYHDGSLLNPKMLPNAWTVSPGLLPTEVLISHYEGRSLRPDENLWLVVVDGDRTVRRHAHLPLRRPVGEIEAGIVTADGIWSWAGERLPPLGQGRAIGVLDADAVVLARDGEIELLRVDSTPVATCAVPVGALFMGPSYDALATRLAVTALQQRGVLIVDAVAGPRWVPVDLEPYHAVWLGMSELLLLDRNALDAVILDLESGSTSSIGLPRRSPWPRVDVTGRFDPAEVRALLRSQRWLPPSRDERDATLAEARRAIEAAAPAALHPLLDSAVPSIRLRATLPTSRRLPLGGSRLGGRPDLPVGHRWPTAGGTPMAFLAQLRLDEISPTAPAGALPSDGLLVVFVGLEPDGGYPTDERAVRAEIVNSSGLKRRGWPKRLVEDLQFRAAAIEPEPSLSLPADPPAPDVDAAAWARVLEIAASVAPHHQMLGHPHAIQECLPPTDENGEFTLLLQLDCDGISGMSFGDGGSLHVWVPRDGLAAGDLSGCVVDLDSY